MSIFVQNPAWYNRALFDHTESVLFVLLWQFWKFSLKLLNSHAVQNSLPQSIGNTHQIFCLMEAQKKSHFSNGSEPFHHKSRLAAACKHNRGLSPFSCNLTPLPAYLWEMSTCSLDVFQGLCMARRPLSTVTHSSPVGSVSWPQTCALLQSGLCLPFTPAPSHYWGLQTCHCFSTENLQFKMGLRPLS